MKFLLQFAGNIFCFFLYSVIGAQLAKDWHLPLPENQNLSWSGFFRTILFFCVIAALSILTTSAFTMALKRHRQKFSPGDISEKVEGSEISPEITVEEKVEEKPESVIDILTESTRKLERESPKEKKTRKKIKKAKK